MLFRLIGAIGRLQLRHKNCDLTPSWLIFSKTKMASALRSKQSSAYYENLDGPGKERYKKKYRSVGLILTIVAYQ